MSTHIAAKRLVAPPSYLYRYRPLEGALFDREIDALRDALLWAPQFSEMNDPMEAFYEFGGAADPFIDRMLAPSGKSTSDMYRMAQKVIDNFCLVSFSSSHMDLPMWAYYASNFAGMCLEFSSEEIFVGDFQNESLLPVTYAEAPLPTISIHDLNDIQTAIESRLSRKCSEWHHEKEWRIICGSGGKRFYVDDALKRIFLGPKTSAAHAKRICEIFRNRPTEILQGRVNGYDLTFKTIQPATPVDACERVGEGKLELEEILLDKDGVTEFLRTPYERLTEELTAIAARPNTQTIHCCDLSGDHNKNAIYVWSEHRLRSGQNVWRKVYFDRDMKKLP